MCIPVLAYGAVLTMPAFLAVLGKYYGMSSKELGSLASAEWFVCIAGTFFANNRTIGQLTKWVIWTCPFAVALNVMALFLAGKIPLIYFHPLGTFASGISYGYALKVFDASGRQQRYYGIFVATFTLSELVIFQLVNYLTVVTGRGAVFLIYAVLAVGAVLITWAVRKPLEHMGEAGGKGQKDLSRRPRPMVLLSVVALGLSYVSFGMIWSFAQLMGVSRSLSPLDVTNGSSAYAVTGILGALAAAALPAKANRSVVLVVAVLALLSAVYLMYIAPGYAWFIVGCAIFGLYWTFYCTTHVSLIAKSDSTGRAIVFCGISPSVGAIIGSFWGGRLIRGDDYLPTGEVGALMAIAGIALTIFTLFKMAPLQAATASVSRQADSAQG
jgi:predicted MFS family arabinose efflux permease